MEDSSKNPQRTEVISGSENVMNTILQFISKANTISSCGDYKAPLAVFEIEEYKKLLFDIKKRGIKVKYITDITKDNINHCKDLIGLFAFDIRHLDGIKANFSISETEYLASATLIDKQVQQWSTTALPVQQLIYSNVKDIVEQQKYVFESFWNKAIPAERRINEIEEGFVLGTTEVIQIPSKTKQLFIDLVKSAKEEVLLLFPTVNSFLREERIGVIQLLKEAATAQERKVKVRIITPVNSNVEKIIVHDMLIDQPKNNFLDIQRIEETRTATTTMAATSKTTTTNTTTTNTNTSTNVNTVTILVVDKKASLVIEKVDDSKQDFVEAIGSATYSTSKPTVLSYISIFENLSNQVKLYEQLKTHDKMQKEFINIASHEMKTPTQAILGYCTLIQRHPEKREEMLNAMSRNALRLQKLTNDILDVTRIESQTLSLNKEVINLNDLILILIEDYKSQIQTEHSNVQILLYDGPKSRNDVPLLIEADRGRISQCISNLLSNAIKFSAKEGIDGHKGIVSITVRKEEGERGVGGVGGERGPSQKEQATVSITNNGEGIHPEIIPRLFTKFATKSEGGGTGLGLYITKSIIEAHGGRIWAENNKDGKGATFIFTLPLSREKMATVGPSSNDQTGSQQ
ncbi:MAG TPA: HAMP domain-containing sensor histidine kinase [Nitrososphaeraceae archaeon]|nr:HAMP domain-containing sensor histidine kinase [Nitrososphaeraceae archaeon]